jgi:hypothetical protein
MGNLPVQDFDKWVRSALHHIWEVDAEAMGLYWHSVICALRAWDLRRTPSKAIEQVALMDALDWKVEVLRWFYTHGADEDDCLKALERLSLVPVICDYVLQSKPERRMR